MRNREYRRVLYVEWTVRRQCVWNLCSFWECRNSKQEKEVGCKIFSSRRERQVIYLEAFFRARKTNEQAIWVKERKHRAKEDADPDGYGDSRPPDRLTVASHQRHVPPPRHRFRMFLPISDLKTSGIQFKRPFFSLLFSSPWKRKRQTKKAKERSS